jgi:type II secretory pathway pseudopilin PulG
MPYPRSTASNAGRAAGFTYIGLLAAVVVLGIGLAAVGTVWHTQAQREREQELLFIGHEFRSAIAAYFRAGRQYPQELDDLLEDKRWPEPRHFLRRLYADPMTGAADWTVLRGDDIGLPGVPGIVGIASASKGEPIKKQGFPSEEDDFKDSKCYCDWKFVLLPRDIRRRATHVLPASD